MIFQIPISKLAVCRCGVGKLSIAERLPSGPRNCNNKEEAPGKAGRQVETCPNHRHPWEIDFFAGAIVPTRLRVYLPAAVGTFTCYFRIKYVCVGTSGSGRAALLINNPPCKTASRSGVLVVHRSNLRVLLYEHYVPWNLLQLLLPLIKIPKHSNRVFKWITLRSWTDGRQPCRRCTNSPLSKLCGNHGGGI